MTTPYFFVEEHQILNVLFDEGLEILHLRKPDTEPVYSERLLTLIQENYRKRIVVHDHFYPVVNDPPEGDYSEPLQLLARRIAFTDPLSGQERVFESRRVLAWAQPAA